MRKDLFEDIWPDHIIQPKSNTEEDDENDSDDDDSTSNNE